MNSMNGVLQMFIEISCPKSAGNESGARFSVFGLKDAGAQPVFSRNFSHFGRLKQSRVGKVGQTASIFLHRSCADLNLHMKNTSRSRRCEHSCVDPLLEHGFWIILGAVEYLSDGIMCCRVQAACLQRRDSPEDSPFPSVLGPQSTQKWMPSML